VLAPKEATTIAKGFTPALVLVTDGTAKVTTEDGQWTTLKRGEAATFDGAITVKAVGSRKATFVAAIVGSDTKPVSELTAAPTTAPAVMGGIRIDAYACPAGSTIENFVPKDCQFAPDVASWTLSSDLLERDLTTEDGGFQNGALVWGGLPLGDYTVWPDQLADGYDDYYIRASAAVARNGDGTTSVTIDQDFPEITLEAYVFPTAAQLAGSISLIVHVCPPGMGVADLNPEECDIAPAAAGYDIALTGYFGGPGLWTLADTTSENDIYTWDNLELGAYNLTETVKPPGYTTYFVPGSAAVGGSPDTGYEITIDETVPSITIDLYNVGLEGVS
jgi:hypothetical protein